jgi:uncharacterized peroxidase-related enzyme
VLTKALLSGLYTRRRPAQLPARGRRRILKKEDVAVARIVPIDDSGCEAETEGARAVLADLKAQYGADFPVTYETMAHRPAALRAFSDFVLAVMAGDALPYKHKELAYLKASMGVECEHCVASHSHYASQAGYSEEQIAALGSHRESPLFSDEEKAILHFSEQTTLRPGPCPVALVEDLQRFFSDAQIVELTLVIGIANTFGRFNNALGVGAAAPAFSATVP